MAYGANQNAGGLETLDNTTVANGDLVVVGDVSDSNRAKGITWTNIKAFLKAYFDTIYGAIASPTFTGTVTTPAIIVSSETASTIASFDASKNVKSLATATYPSLTELSYVKGVTSALQTQLNAKASTLSGTNNEIAYFNSGSTIASLTTATYPSLTELSYVKGVTSAIQTQLNNKISAGTQVVAIPRPLMPYSGVGARALNNNVDGYVHMFSLDKQIVVNKITFNVTAVGTSGTFNIGIFSEDGQTRYISVTTASISGTGLVTTAVSAVTLPAGNYIMLLGSVSTADISVSEWAALSPVSALRAVSSEPTLCGTYTVTASTMPSTITLASISSGTDGAFVFRLDN